MLFDYGKALISKVKVGGRFSITAFVCEKVITN